MYWFLKIACDCVNHQHCVVCRRHDANTVNTWTQWGNWPLSCWMLTSCRTSEQLRASSRDLKARRCTTQTPGLLYSTVSRAGRYFRSSLASAVLQQWQCSVISSLVPLYWTRLNADFPISRQVFWSIIFMFVSCWVSDGFIYLFPKLDRAIWCLFYKVYI